MKLDLLNKEVSDPYARENFFRLKRDLEKQSILDGDFKFFELELEDGFTSYQFTHNLGFIPKDIIVLHISGDQNLYFEYDSFTSNFLYITNNGPCRVRFLAGLFANQSYGGSNKDFAFGPPMANAFTNIDGGFASSNYNTLPSFDGGNA